MEPTKRGSLLFYQVLRNKKLWLVASLFFLEQFFFYTWTGWTPALMMLKGATPDVAGYIASIPIWAGIPTVYFVPQIAYRLGLRKPFLWGPSLFLALASWLVISANLTMIWPLMALVGVANLTRWVILLALPVEIMSKQEVGTASGLVISIGALGGIIGPLIGGYILDLTGTLDLSLLVLTGVSIAAAGIAFRLPETGAKTRYDINRA